MVAMGLDMYLWTDSRELASSVSAVMTGGRCVRDDLVGYWRKANAIHNWFSERLAPDVGLEDLEKAEVSPSVLAELRDDCMRVLAGPTTTHPATDAEIGSVASRLKIGPYGPIERADRPMVLDDPSVAAEVLPTCDGYFFGSLAYDEGYLEDLRYTVRLVDAILARLDVDGGVACVKGEPGRPVRLEYQAWW